MDLPAHLGEPTPLAGWGRPARISDDQLIQHNQVAQYTARIYVGCVLDAAAPNGEIIYRPQVKASAKGLNTAEWYT